MTSTNEKGIPKNFLFFTGLLFLIIGLCFYTTPSLFNCNKSAAQLFGSIFGGIGLMSIALTNIVLALEKKNDKPDPPHD